MSAPSGSSAAPAAVPGGAAGNAPLSGDAPAPGAVRAEPHTQVSVVALAGEHRLTVARAPHETLLRICDAEGGVRLSIHVTAAGPVLRLEGPGLLIQAAGDLAIQAGHISLAAETGISLASGGDIVVHAQGDLHSTARIQSIVADLGNVNVRANDDVRLNGERVLMNCEG